MHKWGTIWSCTTKHERQHTYASLITLPLCSGARNQCSSTQSSKILAASVGDSLYKVWGFSDDRLIISSLVWGSENQVNVSVFSPLTSISPSSLSSSSEKGPSDLTAICVMWRGIVATVLRCSFFHLRFSGALAKTSCVAATTVNWLKFCCAGLFGCREIRKSRT